MPVSVRDLDVGARFAAVGRAIAVDHDTLGHGGHVKDGESHKQQHRQDHHHADADAGERSARKCAGATLRGTEVTIGGERQLAKKKGT